MEVAGKRCGRRVARENLQRPTVFGIRAGTWLLVQVLPTPQEKESLVAASTPSEYSISGDLLNLPRLVSKQVGGM